MTSYNDVVETDYSPCGGSSHTDTGIGVEFPL
jgi:hypothetical protein